MAERREELFGRKRQVQQHLRRELDAFLESHKETAKELGKGSGEDGGETRVRSMMGNKKDDAAPRKVSVSMVLLFPALMGEGGSDRHPPLPQQQPLVLMVHSGDTFFQQFR